MMKSFRSPTNFPNDHTPRLFLRVSCWCDNQVEDASSSDDEQVSQPARSPARSSSDSTGASSFYRYGDFSLSTRKLPAAKQASDELSSLMAFDLPEEALQDKVKYRIWS